MAEENKSGAFASSGAVVAAFAAMGVYYFHREAPLVDLRPLTGASIQESATQTVEARLWQDPLAAVERSASGSDKQSPEQRCKTASDGNNCRPPSLGGDDAVLAVTVRGGSYQEDAEQRRRTRYSVLAGLERTNFWPTDAFHIDYFLWKNGPGDFIGPELPAQLASHISIKEHKPVIVPYEKFTNKEDKTVHVLWLREEFLKDHPFKNLSSLASSLSLDTSHFKIVGPLSSGSLQDMAKEAAGRGHLTPNCDADGGDDGVNDLSGIEFFAYGANATDEEILGVPDCTIHQYFRHFGIDVRRTTATNDVLAEGIVHELNRRGVRAGQPVALISEWDTAYGRELPEIVRNKFHESWRSTKDKLDKETQEKEEAQLVQKWLYKFTYLRGLDGLLPPLPGKDVAKQNESSTDGKASGHDRQLASTDFFKVEQDTQSLERPIGQSQYDYLRRIGAQLQEIDNHYRKKDKRIVAIGILGNDAFDKLLILRALRPEFPDALFFTTDFDEAFTIKSELPFTRNLLIASSFGPYLSNWLQGDIPYFRDTYQTSAFLATQLALGSLRGDNNADKSKDNYKLNYLSNKLYGQLAASRVFEIKRNGEILSFVWVPPSSQRIKDPEIYEELPARQLIARKKNNLNTGFSEAELRWPCAFANSVVSCGNIHPVDADWKDDHNPDAPKPVEKLYPTFTERGGFWLPKVLTIGAFVTFLACLRGWVPGKRLEIGFISFSLMLAASAGIYWEPLANWLTSSGEGEPITFLDGVSIWPTILLRIVGILLAIYFIWRTQRELNDNLKCIFKEMNIELERPPLLVQLKSLSKSHPFVLLRPSPKVETLDSSPQKVKAIWQAYGDQQLFLYRLFRAAFFTILMFIFNKFVLLPVFGMPSLPHRSELADKVYVASAWVDWLLMQFLIFIVFDVTLSCLVFVKKIGRETEWPEKTLIAYNGRLRLNPSKHVYEWIDLDFVAKRTRCISSLIYFPFVLLALLVVSRSTLFANYPPSIVIIVSQVISLSIVFSCAFMLWRTANSTREAAREKLREGIIRAQNSESTKYFAKQLESLLARIDQLNEGAFSPLAQQPLVKALLFPLSSAGWIALVESGMLPGW